MTETSLKELGIEFGKDLLTNATELMIAYNNTPKMYEFLIKRGLGLARDQHSEDDDDQKGISIS